MKKTARIIAALLLLMFMAAMVSPFLGCGKEDPIEVPEETERILPNMEDPTPTEEIVIEDEPKVEIIQTPTPTPTPIMPAAPVSVSTDSEIYLFGKLVIAEAGNQGEEGMRRVIDVVLNRRDHACFPNTITDVIMQKYQFEPVWSGAIDMYDPPNDYIFNIIAEEMAARQDSDVIFFCAGGYSQYGKPMYKLGDHYFSSYD